VIGGTVVLCSSVSRCQCHVTLTESRTSASERAGISTVSMDLRPTLTTRGRCLRRIDPAHRFGRNLPPCSSLSNEFRGYFNDARPHQGLGQKRPATCSINPVVLHLHWANPPASLHIRSSAFFTTTTASPLDLITSQRHTALWMSDSARTTQPPSRMKPKGPAEVAASLCRCSPCALIPAAEA
jgi:hypothetical protein